MRNFAMSVYVALSLGVGVHPAMAQMAEQKCVSVSDANLPVDLKAWAGLRSQLTAASSVENLQLALPVGTPVTITLAPAVTVKFAKPPEKIRTPSDNHAGLIELTLPRKGVWRISFSNALWVDVIKDGAYVKSGAHGMLAPCTSLRKIVEFEAEQGRYLVQLSGNPGPDVVMMVTQKP